MATAIVESSTSIDLDRLKVEDDDPQVVAAYSEELERKGFSNVEEVVKQLRKAGPRLLDRSPAYTQVLAFVIHWEDIDVAAVTESANLMKQTFQGNYGFEVKEILLKRTVRLSTPDLQLLLAISNHLNEFLKEEGEGLVIIYYTGHGILKNKKTENGDDLHCFWAARNAGRDVPELDWTTVRRNLQDILACDVLFIFDCCHAEAMIDLRFRWKRRCEMLAAAGITEEAGAGDTSFSRAVVMELKERTNRVGFLASEIRTSLSNPKKMTRLGLKATPHHDRMSNPRFDSMRLGRLRSGADVGSQTSSITIGEIKASTTARMLVKIRFANPSADLIKEEIEAWLRKTLPSSIEDIDFAAVREAQVHSLFESESSLAIFSVPLWVWDLIPHSPACQALGIIRSGDLLRPMISPPKAVPVPTASPSASFFAPTIVPEASSVKVRPNYRAKAMDMFSGPGRPSKRLDRLVSDEPRPRILSRQPYLDDDVDRQCERRLKRHGLDGEMTDFKSRGSFALPRRVEAISSY
ncbi:hypothetical protein BGZ57DRAFT_145714 [Hyaloscypha finlandica]|nr:hypothetical protein BGZ57DRAFT_145714 [Hyaloscypha finlandica]